MPRKKIIDNTLEEKIIDLLERTNRHMSIKEITERLESNYDIKRSPQVVLRHLETLKKKNKIIEKQNGKKKI